MEYLIGTSKDAHVDVEFFRAGRSDSHDSSRAAVQRREMAGGRKSRNIDRQDNGRYRLDSARRKFADGVDHDRVFGSSHQAQGLHRVRQQSRGQELQGGIGQGDEAVQPGNSGGPVLDASGLVIGVVVSLTAHGVKFGTSRSPWTLATDEIAAVGQKSTVLVLCVLE
jgi:hypothetical protein